MKRYLLIVLAFTALAAKAQDVRKTAYEAIDRQENPFSLSVNPAYTDQLRFDKLTDIRLHYAHENGDFRPADAGKSLDDVGFSLYGIQKYGKLAFEGDISYNHDKEKERRWNSTLYPSALNPFKIGDLVQSDFTQEAFRLDGAVSYQFSSSWTGGIGGMFRSGSLANEADPRPLVSGIRFRLTPGIAYRTGNQTFGISTLWERLSESLAYTQVKSTNSYNAYLMQGLMQPIVKSSSSYRRKYFGNDFGANAQWCKEGNTLNYFDIGWRYQCEAAKDGSTGSYFRGGDFHHHEISAQDRYQWKSGMAQHTVLLRLQEDLVKGTVFEQTQTYDSSYETIWRTDDRYTGYEDYQTQVGLQYTLDSKKTVNGALSSAASQTEEHQTQSSQLPKYSLSAEAGYLMDQSKGNPHATHMEASFGLAQVRAEGIYRFCIRSCQLSALASVGASVRTNHNLDIPYTGEVTPYKIIANNYLRPLYEYRSASRLQGRLRLDAQWPLSTRWGKTWAGLFAQYDIQHYLSNYEVEQDTYTSTYGAYEMLSGQRHRIEAGLSLSF